ncbi:nuclear transport factor 2 family protein [Sinorhizobium terangae]|uniref:Nuclear transport factor 2 family protein n=1 Tax=Sinorhizobium terangae TaxID=110322 RepID=A0A6N7LDL3_SINTE|nr:nuclear transport factor 2 family protein [Sinorhizobium terangae]MBB4186229.1 ketosteroid isomerase-like protein [Sinorhizobium terangae]MQX15852.1 nuclear transport factor 2 family protein [Sinorhizobium terangae]MQX19076.1 nuclear transport factor 2 family protein [Sinorhizobium terangae]WFU51115.1 nuclear transport factor 2 family protein [Sinorhizobium terangae]
MPLKLPKPVADYFAADAKDGSAVANRFTPDAVVIDERQTYTGRKAIARWKAESSTKYEYSCEPIAAEEEGGKIIVTAHLTGNFPGSPVDLRYAFVLAGDAIAHLEIA